MLWALAWVCGLGVQGAEPWADERLPATAGLEMWFDASRQSAGRAALQLPPITSGNPVDYLVDGSGRGRHLQQPRREARPQFRQEFSGAFLNFDGREAVLSRFEPGLAFTNLTVFLVAAPRSNPGDFRGLMALTRAGANDYRAGLNIDLGPFASATLAQVNVEGAGFGGADDLLKTPGLPLGAWHVFSLLCAPGPDGVRLFLDGAARGARTRQPGRIQADVVTLGARHYSNIGETAYTQGFLDGEVAEALVYGRVLSEAERAGVERYLGAKYGALLARPPELAERAKPLVAVTNPPAVQMFVPGFATRRLPLKLSNINNLKYRADGKLVALGYDGRIWLLSDTDGDGLEDHAELFWGGQNLRAPIGMALTPPGYARGEGVFVAAKGKLALLVDTNGDGRADREIVVAEGWKELSHGVDALGAAVDPQGNVYFGLGAANYTDPYLVDKSDGAGRYRLDSERGTILKVSPDFQHREILATGVRFPVALAFNRAGDLFCTDQEGATWLPNGNPFDELLHIEAGRHYGFPPRHPKFLPGVVDEPSVFDYAPQHQSTCGLNFNDPVNGGPVFGPASWGGDAFVSGYSRGKIWRTKLVKTGDGYVAQTMQLASLPKLTVDACVSPRGDLVVSTHGGEPDWGSGPNGEGGLYQVRYADPAAPQPVLAWAAGPSEFHIAFDRPLDPAALKDLAHRTEITAGAYVGAGDRFEVQRPGYAAVHQQLASPRLDVPVRGARMTPDRRTLVLAADPAVAAVRYAVALAGFDSAASREPGRLPQEAAIDVVTDLSGLSAEWTPSPGASGATAWEGWVPHADLRVARDLVAGSAEHEALWPRLDRKGTLKLAGQLDLWQMLQPAIQPGSTLDHERPVERTTVVFSAGTVFTLRWDGRVIEPTPAAGGFEARATVASGPRWTPFELVLPTGASAPRLTVSWFTADDPRPRAFPLRRFIVPWAKPAGEAAEPAAEREIPELAGGDWAQGRRIFFGETVGCFKCHTLRGEGNRVGPDLANLPQRDYTSVRKDIVFPNAALNPDHLAYNVVLRDGGEFTAVLETETADEITLAGPAGRTVIARSRIQSIEPSATSLMPEGLDKILTPGQFTDLMAFLLTPPLAAAPIRIEGAPAARRPAEIEAALGPIANRRDPPGSAPLQVVLCAGPKDHGTDEHDYPLWQKRWARLLALADGVSVDTAWEWPSADQFRDAQVVVFYSDNPGWSRARADQLGEFLARTNGAVFLHWAVDGHDQVEALARLIGPAWRGGASKFRHGPLALEVVQSPFTQGLAGLHLHDESYWDLVGGLEGCHVLASSVEDGQARPLVWTKATGAGRVFVCIPGHYSWTFDDPLFRALVLRGISWAGGQPVDRLTPLSVVGARMASP